MDITKFLSEIFLFRSLSEEQLELVEAATSIKKVKKGEQVFSDGQPATAFFIIVSGLVKIYKLSSEGNEHIIHIQKLGDMIAEATIFDFKEYPAYCEAMADTVLVRVSRDKFIELLHHFPEISFKIMANYSRRLRQLIIKIEELSLHDIKSRLAGYLLNNCTLIDNKNVCCLTLSKKDLASVLGTIPETLSRTFNFFKKQEIISGDKTEITILNKTRLKEFSNK